jgi:flagellar L-ring protein precursor FlgH
MHPMRLTFMLGLLGAALCALAADTPPAPATLNPLPVAMPAELTGSLWSGHSRSLILDTTARAVGDLLTVIVEQQSVASTTAKHETSKSMGVNAGKGTGWLDGFRGMGAKADRTTNGSGASTASTRLLDHLTVTVVAVLPNGNLRIAGSRTVTLEKDTVILSFSGVVRPEDITLDNTLSSISVADQCLVASGVGPIAEKQRPGWFSRLLAVLF